MNKKFSTLLTTALFMGGALFSEAYAESLKSYLETSPAAKVENGTKYVLIQKGVTANGAALGIEAFKDKVVTYRAFDAASDIDLNNLEIDDFLWTVNESTVVNGVYTVTFTNEKYSLSLNVLNDGTTLVTDYNTTTSGYSNRWVWEGYKTYENASPKRLYAGELALNEKINGTSNPLYVLNYDGSSSFHTQVVDGAIQGFDLYEVKDQEVPSEELNALYNSAGFNLKISKDGITNAFDNGKTIKAVGVESGKVLTKEGYKYASNTFEGFPAGTYFLSETPAGKVPDAGSAELYSYLLNSTFVVLSASDNVATSATVQATGEGFTLKEVAGKDLNLYLGTDANFVSSGTTVSVNNAAFTVMNNATNKDNYALSVANFRYKNSTAATHVSKTVGLAVKSNGSYGSSEYLVSDPAAGTNNFIFQFVESTIKKGSDLLNANGASIYNIKFVGGDVDGFYLTNAYDGGSLKNFAKGVVLSDPATPAFQYVITKVDGNDVTFTNRETGAAFTAKLFDKGNNKYTLALTTKTTADDYFILNVQNNGDVKKTSATAEDLDLSEVELVAVTSVDKFAGFMDEADEAKVTLTFARDEDPTSNKLYPLVKEDPAGTFSWNKMTDNVSEAAQWQLVKDEKPTYETRTYAYIDADEKVAYKSEGDTVAYYTYKFQYVKDGIVENAYLNNSNLTTSLPTNGTEYIVKENVNGSVSIVTAINSNEAFYSEEQLVVTDYEKVKTDEKDRTLYSWDIAQESEATDIKAYIVLDAPEVTLPATATYVTLKSEVGNYSLGVDGERDAVYTTEPTTIRVFATDLKSEIPSFFVTTGWNEEDGSRMFLFNPSDSVNYYVGAGKYDKEYQWNVDVTKAIFKAAKLNATLDTLTTSILGKTTKVAMKADNSGVQGGLDYFKYQIFLADADEADDLYIVRTLAAADNNRYLYQENGKFGWTNDRNKAMKFYIDNVEAPTANESINAANNVIVAGVNGAVVVKGAEGKNVIVSTILGKVVANEVVSSDNATIAAPAGIVVVSVDGESFKVVVK